VKRTTVSTGPIAVLGPLALLSLFLLSSSGTAGVVVPVSATSSDATAMRLLARASSAPQTVSYRGLQFVSAWSKKGSTGLVVHVVHRPGSGTTVTAPATAWTPAERTHLAALDTARPRLSGRPRVHWERLLFSAKEAVYKVWSPRTGEWLGFEEAEVSFDPERETFTARILVPGPFAELTGRYLVEGGTVVTAIVVPASSPAVSRAG